MRDALCYCRISGGCQGCGGCGVVLDLSCEKVCSRACGDGRKWPTSCLGTGIGAGVAVGPGHWRVPEPNSVFVPSLAAIQVQNDARSRNSAGHNKRRSKSLILVDFTSHPFSEGRGGQCFGGIGSPCRGLRGARPVIIVLFRHLSRF